MLNEIQEFLAYTQAPAYTAISKRDTSYLGRFTFQGLMDFEGLGRVLTIIARGYLFTKGEDPYTQIDYTRAALCAWCSVPEKTKKAPRSRADQKVNFSDLSPDFPELVDKNGHGWFYRHVKNIIRFVRNHPNTISKSAEKAAENLAKNFTIQWKKKVKQLQIPLFAPNTKGAWVLRFDDILADAIEQGPLQNRDFDLPKETLDLLSAKTPKGCPDTLLPMLAKYYLAHLQEPEEWVVLPISTVDAYYCNNNFSKKWKSALPKDLFQFQSSYGICKYKLHSAQTMTTKNQKFT